MHLDAVDGIVRDVIEGFKTLPRRGLEVGGLLLGRVVPGDRPTVWIERYQRIPCEHRFGPQFVLDEEDRHALESAAVDISQSGELSVIGLYRSHTRGGFGLEEPDFDLMNRYFADSSDLILLIKPENMVDVWARFFARDDQRAACPVGEEFLFRGHAVGVISRAREEEDPEERTSRTLLASEASAASEGEDRPQEHAEPEVSEPQVPLPSAGEHPRRLVPDFIPAPVEQPRAQLREVPPPGAEPWKPSSPDLHWGYESPSFADHLKKWWPVFAALALVGGLAWFLLRPAGQNGGAPAPAALSANVRPLGLYVDPAGDNWRISWNPNATALHNAKSVQLFVREGDDQNRIDLSPRDLASGTYQYKPNGNDVTFRLEVIGSSGQVSAESFRYTRATAPASTQAPPTTAPKPASSGEDVVTHVTQPRAIHKVPPVVPASIRPRIKGVIAIDVRVHIDARGRVTSAAALTKPNSGLESYLAGRAVEAAKQWRFEPGRKGRTAIPGAQTIHFVFEK
jgi:hypothetical protein